MPPEDRAPRRNRARQARITTELIEIINRLMRSKLETLRLDPGYVELVQQLTEGRTSVKLVAKQRQIDRLSTSTRSSTASAQSDGDEPW